MRPDPTKPGRRRVPLLAIGALLAALVSIAVPNFQAAAERSRVRSCYDMQKQIAGAVEMYALDKNQPRRPISLDLLRALRSGGYVHDIVGAHDHVHAQPYWKTFQSTPGGNGVRCAVHGSIQ